jgi:hypothetical protein
MVDVRVSFRRYDSLGTNITADEKTKTIMRYLLKPLNHDVAAIFFPAFLQHFLPTSPQSPPDSLCTPPPFVPSYTSSQSTINSPSSNDEVDASLPARTLFAGVQSSTPITPPPQAAPRQPTTVPADTKPPQSQCKNCLKRRRSFGSSEKTIQCVFNHIVVNFFCTSRVDLIFFFSFSRDANDFLAFISGHNYVSNQTTELPTPGERRVRTELQFLKIFVQYLTNKNIGRDEIFDIAFQGLWTHKRIRNQHKIGGSNRCSAIKGMRALTAFVDGNFKSPQHFSRIAIKYLWKMVKSKTLEESDVVPSHIKEHLQNQVIDTINRRLESVSILIKTGGQLSYRVYDNIRRVMLKDQNPLTQKWEKWKVRF